MARWQYDPNTGALVDTNATPDDDTLGACGCVDYHMADCPTRTGGSFDSPESIWAAVERQQRRADYYGEDY